MTDVVIASDDFNRADNPTDLGANWNNMVSGFSVLGNRAHPTTSADCMVRWVGAGSFSNDQYAEVGVTNLAAPVDQTTGPGPAVRCTSGADYYRAVANLVSGGTVQVGKFVGGGFTQIGGPWTTPIANGDTIRLEVQGTTLRVYVNHVQIQTDITDTSITSGVPGMTFSANVGANGDCDNWVAGNLVGLGPPKFIDFMGFI